MKKLALTAALALFGSCAQPLPESESLRADEVWVTIGSDAVEVLQEFLAEDAGALAVYDSSDRATVIKVQRETLPRITHFMHENFQRCGGYIVHDSYAEAYEELDEKRPRQTAEKAISYTIDNASAVNTLTASVSESDIRSVITHLSTNYINRYYTTQSGVDAAVWIRDHWASLIPAGRNDVSVELYSHAGYPQDSVIMTIVGDTLPDEVVVVGGHLDSTIGSGTGPSTVAPGADDDASGIATTSEVIRVLLANGFHPDRTVKFMGYAAEEVGLRGSGDIADEHAAQGVNVVGVLQLDMTNYNGHSTDILMINDNTNVDQNGFVTDLIDTYVGSTWGYINCGYGCSDHASWHSAGFPASMPFEATMSTYNPTIHTSNDTIAQSGGTANYAVQFAKLGAAYVAELAKGDFTEGATDPEVCDNGTDDDGDGDTDCADSDCGSDPACLPSNETSCTDGVDNDGDGATDCADSDCVNDPACLPETACADGLDDDGDGATDCADSDCASDPACTGGWTILSNDDFESGWGSYTDGGSDTRRSVNDSAYAHQGSYCVRIRDNSGSASSFYTTGSFDLSARSELRVEFWYRPVGMENGEDFFVELWDGSNWMIIADYVSGTDFSNNSFYNSVVTVNSGSPHFSSDARLRFRADASANNDRVYIDEVKVEAR